MTTDTDAVREKLVEIAEMTRECPECRGIGQQMPEVRFASEEPIPEFCANCLGTGLVAVVPGLRPICNAPIHFVFGTDPPIRRDATWTGYHNDCEDCHGLGWTMLEYTFGAVLAAADAAGFVLQRKFRDPEEGPYWTVRTVPGIYKIKDFDGDDDLAMVTAFGNAAKASVTAPALVQEAQPEDTVTKLTACGCIALPAKCGSCDQPLRPNRPASEHFCLSKERGVRGCFRDGRFFPQAIHLSKKLTAPQTRVLKESASLDGSRYYGRWQVRSANILDERGLVYIDRQKLEVYITDSGREALERAASNG